MMDKSAIGKSPRIPVTTQFRLEAVEFGGAPFVLADSALEIIAEALEGWADDK